VTAEYWFISTTGGWARVGYPVTEAVLAHFRAAVTAIVSGIEDGVFVALPSASSTNPRWECPFCDPDRLGVADLRRQFERKSVDPRLAIFAAADGTAEAG
jgi:hypothetical protein